MQYLPTPEEQDWLIARLAELIASGGKERFLEMPVVEPSRRFFPDPWTFSHRGLDRLVRRLMQYAGLTELDVKVGTFIEMENRSPVPEGHAHRSTAGVFMGIVDGQCLFAFNEESPADAEYMAGVMGHEVAHAYRAHHGLVVSTRPLEEEERITDVTTVYLGFGILSANNSFRYRTAGSLGFQSWSFGSAGYLPSQAFAFLLANQMVARDSTPAEVRRLLGQLETDQAAFTEAALKVAWDRQPDTMRTFGLTAADRQRAPKRLEEILQPLPEYAGTEPTTAGVSPHAADNRGRPVFRVPRNRVLPYMALGSGLGLVVGLIGAIALDRFAIFALAFLAGPALGAFRGSRTRFEVCSDPGCAAILTDAETCPECGGIIAGSIKHQDDRLEAEEAWERAHGGALAAEPKARKLRRVATDANKTA